MQVNDKERNTFLKRWKNRRREKYINVLLKKRGKLEIFKFKMER